MEDLSELEAGTVRYGDGEAASDFGSTPKENIGSSAAFVPAMVPCFPA
jgi:hypothetical protein